MLSTKDFNSVSFSLSENEERYKAYSEKNPDMPADEIVWRVNNNLDFEKYGYDVIVSGYDDLCIIINKYFKVPFSYCPPDLVEADGCLMRSEVAEAYIKLRDTAKSEGYSIKVTSAYRSAEDQKKMYDFFLCGSTVEITDCTVARPGYSEHHSGLAIDVEGSIPGGRNIAQTPEAGWISENCHKFGFILRYLPGEEEITGYSPEPWHLRYIGVRASCDMRAKNIKTLEEYKERFLK